MNVTFITQDDQSGFDVTRARGHEPRRDGGDGQPDLRRPVAASPKLTTRSHRCRRRAGTQNSASVFVKLTPIEARDRDQFAIMEQVDRDSPPPANMLSVGGGGGPGGGGGVQYVLQGPELSELQRYSSQLLEKVKTIPGVVDADHQLNDGSRSCRCGWIVRRRRSSGCSLSDAADALRCSWEETPSPPTTTRAQQHEVHVRAEAADRGSEEALGQLPVPSSRLGLLRSRTWRASRPARPSDIVAWPGSGRSR